jgi:hypothetical protein
VHRIATGDDGDRAFALSRPPEAIRGEEIVTAGDPLWEGAERSPHADLLQAARESRLVGVRGKTLADLTDTPAPRVILSDPAPAPAAMGAPN